MQAMEARPPYVMFETRSIEDREASEKAGHYVGKDVDFVLITPAGSKDRIDRNALEWLAQCRIEVQAERLPVKWEAHYREAYKNWKEGQEAPVDGTPLINWPGLSPTQYKQLQALHIRAVEDLAAANEETINRLGMGGRQLKQRAVDYLAAAKDVGAVAEAASTLRARAEASESREKLLNERLEAMAARLQALEGGTAPRNESATAAIQASDFLDDDQPQTRRPL